MASRKAVPGGSKVVVAVAWPPVSPNGPKEPSTVFWSLASALRETSSIGPVGVGETVTEAVNVDPEFPEVGFGVPSVVVVAVRTAEVQLAKRFATLIEPSPVARSYPLTAVKPGFPSVTEPFGAFGGFALYAELPEVSTPNPDVELLQFGVPASQATVMVPFVTS